MLILYFLAFVFLMLIDWFTYHNYEWNILLQQLVVLRYNIIGIMGQTCLSDKTVVSGIQNDEPSRKSRVENVDVVKAKLKHARDRINNFVSKKENDRHQLDIQIAQKLPKYQVTGNKKELIPLLQAKKAINQFIQTANVRLRLINDKLMQVETQQMNADTINVLDDANMYLRKIENELEQKDWRRVLQEAEHKYHMDWDQYKGQDLQNDPAFQNMWRQLQGNQLIAQKQVTVEVPRGETNNLQYGSRKKQVLYD